MTATVERTDVPGAPTGREEAWRFTPLTRLRGLHLGVDSPRSIAATLQTPAGWSFEVVPTETLPIAAGAIEWPAALARAATRESGVLTLSANSSANGPCVVTVDGDSIEGSTVAHLVVRAEAGARGTVVIEHRGSLTLSANIELEVGDNADLTVVSVQDWASDTVHLGRQHAVLGRNSRLTSLVATLGGGVVRIVPTVEFTAPGGEVEMLGVFFAESGEHIEHRLLVDHTQPHCRSRVTYKGALQGDDAHSVWVGDVIIRAAAVGTDTYEINRNLLLTEGARADSVPNLEIETGSVTGAGHASATGRFDDEQLFYLQARGIDADTARRLVVRGFFADVVSRIDAGGVGERIMAVVESKLGGAGSATDEGGI